MIYKIASRAQFAEYILRRLGKPVIDINVAPEQLEDRIDDALIKWHEYHQDGSIRAYFKHKITQADLDNNAITLPDNIMAVVRVLNTSAMGFNTYDIQYVAYMSDLLSGALAGGLANYVQSLSYIETLNNILNLDKSVQFIKFGNKLVFDATIKNVAVGEFIILECYTLNDTDLYPKSWNETWLKDYATALVKKQWADNLIKYQGFTLPNGMTIDGQAILAEAKEEIATQEEKLREVYEYPIDMMLG